MAKHTDRSIAFDLVEMVEQAHARIERAKYEPRVLADRDWLMEQKTRLGVLTSQLKERAMKERLT